MSDLLALLAGGLNFLNGVVQLLLKLAELWEKFKQSRRFAYS